MNNLCDSIDTLSMAYLDDELAAEELRDLELHLRDCAACRAHVDAERDAIAELRRRLAPPPAPDLLRRRLMVALDAEDAQTARAPRTSWILPGAASVAAVAALVLFFVSRTNPPAATKPAAPSIAEQLVQQQVRSPRIAPNPDSSRFQMDVGDGRKGALGLTQQPRDTTETLRLRKVASWDSTFRGREVTTQLFQLGDAVIQASVFDADGWDLAAGSGERINYAGLDLRYGYADGVAMVIYQSADNTGFVFSATDLAADDLMKLVATRDLVSLVAR